MATTTPFRIIELREDQPGGFCPRGGAREFWRYRGHESILSGPAETGKTWTSCQLLNALLWKYPGSQGVIARKLQTTLYGTVLQTYTRVAAPDGWDRSPIKRYGGERPEWYDYPNNSRLWVCGLDNPQKALSSERSFVYVNQAEEIDVHDWEMMLTRCTGRGSTSAYPRMFGDCNPGPPSHWILHRPILKVFQTYHTDNPTLYGEDGTVTEQGTRTLEILSSLTGLRRDRLFLGKWVQAEGAIYENYNQRIHRIARREFPDDWPRYWDVDFGYTNPFVWHEWVVDPDGRIYRNRELYLTQTLVEDALSLILSACLKTPRPKAIICDHDAEDRATWERHCVYCSECRRAIRRDETSLHSGHTLTTFNLATRAAYKDVSPGIQAVSARLKVTGDGRPRLYLVDDALIHDPDPNLLARKRPHCTEQEIEVYVWDTSRGQRPKEQPLKQDDHGMDGMRYLVAHLDNIGTISRKIRLL